jgi:hypothetical protein
MIAANRALTIRGMGKFVLACTLSDSSTKTVATQMFASEGVHMLGPRIAASGAGYARERENKPCLQG